MIGHIPLRTRPLARAHLVIEGAGLDRTPRCLIEGQSGLQILLPTSQNLKKPLNVNKYLGYDRVKHPREFPDPEVCCHWIMVDYIGLRRKADDF